MPESTISSLVTDQMENIIDIREHDVPYHIRVAIDNQINVVHSSQLFIVWQ